MIFGYNIYCMILIILLSIYLFCVVLSILTGIDKLYVYKNSYLALSNKKYILIERYGHISYYYYNIVDGIILNKKNVIVFNEKYIKLIGNNFIQNGFLGYINPFDIYWGYKIRRWYKLNHPDLDTRRNNILDDLGI